MTSCWLTPKASAGLFEIWSYIAADKPADRVENGVHEACARIAQAPLAGQVREDLTALPLRFCTLGRYSNYLIVHDPANADHAHPFTAV